MLGGLDWNEPKVDQRLELHIWGRSKCVEEELELLVMALRLDLDHIMEVTVRICLEGDVHLHCKTGGEGALHVVLNLEL